jgi:hypothetical protein
MMVTKSAATSQDNAVNGCKPPNNVNEGVKKELGAEHSPGGQIQPAETVPSLKRKRSRWDDDAGSA